MIKVSGKEGWVQVDLIVEPTSKMIGCLRVRMISDTGEEIVADMTRDRLVDFAVQVIKEAA